MDRLRFAVCVQNGSRQQSPSAQGWNDSHRQYPLFCADRRRSYFLKRDQHPLPRVTITGQHRVIGFFIALLAGDNVAQLHGVPEGHDGSEDVRTGDPVAGASADFDNKHPCLLSLPAFGLDRRVFLGVVEGQRLGQGWKLKHASHWERYIIAFKNMRNWTEVQNSPARFL